MHFSVAALAFLALIPTLTHGQLVPATGEIQANTFTTGNQKTTSVAADANGNFVVTWESRDQDGSFYGVFAQRHDSSGAPVGTEFQVNTYTTGHQESQSVGMDTTTGNFVVMWGSVAQDGSSDGIFGRRFSSSGTPEGAEFQANIVTAGSQFHPIVAIDPDTGDFLVAWSSSLQDGAGAGVFGRRYSSSGVGAGVEFQINTYTTGNQNEPAIGFDPSSGNFLVAWTSAQDGSSSGIFGRLLDNAGGGLGTEFQINTFTGAAQDYPSVGMDPSTGTFIVAWRSSGQDGNVTGIFGRRLDSVGAALGTEFQVNSYTTGDQEYPRVAVDPTSGSFVISWTSEPGDGSYRGVFSQRYDSNGAPVGSEFQVNAHIKDDQYKVSSAALGGDRFLISWTDSSGLDGCLGSGTGVFGRRYSSNGTGIGSEFQVNSFTAYFQYSPSIGRNPTTGDFVVAWTSAYQDGDQSGAFAQRFNSSGGFLGTEFQLNTHTIDDQEDPTVGTVSSTGDFVVVWNSALQDGDNDGVFGRRFDNSGVGLGSEFQVNAFTTGRQSSSTLAVDQSNGNFVVVWESVGQDGDSYGVFGQRYASNGALHGSEFQVNSYTSGSQRLPHVAADSTTGNFAVTWSGLDGNASGVFMQRYDSAGTPLGTEFQMNTYTTNAQIVPVAGIDPNTGNMFITWDSFGQDSNAFGVFGRRYDSNGIALGTEFQVNTYTSGMQRGDSVAVDSNTGDLVVAWQSPHDGSGYGVFGRRYNSAGAAQGAEFQLNTFTADSQDDPAASFDQNTGEFVVAWSSYSQDGCGATSEAGAFFRLYAEATPTPTPDPSMPTCPPTPAMGCAVSTQGKLIVKDNADDAKDKLIWKFGKGPLLSKGNFGDPTSTHGVAFCVYDDLDKKIDLQIPPGSNWADVSDKGYQYKNQLGTIDGVTKIKLLGGVVGKSKLQLKGKGAGLSVPGQMSGSPLFDSGLTVVAQLHGNGTCWETEFLPMQATHKENLYKGKF